MNFIEKFKNIEKEKETFKNKFKEKADVLQLKKDPESRVKWPWTSKRDYNSYFKPCSTVNVKQAPKSKISKHTRPLYWKQWLSISKEQAAILKLRTHVSLQEINDKTNYEVSDLVGGFVFQNCKNIDTRKSESIQGLSLDLLDNIFANLANISKPVTENEAELDWEYVMGNMLKLGLPQTVIDRVSKRMEEANKSSPAITAMNVTRPLLSDLTITTAEVEMQQEIQRMVAENEVYESKPEDEPFEDSVKWLIDLDRKDQYSKDKEIEEIHLDYTNLLNKKGA